jgi:hypothetical protein
MNEGCWLRAPGRNSTVWSGSGLEGKYFLSGGDPWILVMEIPEKLEDRLKSLMGRAVSQIV